MENLHEGRRYIAPGLTNGARASLQTGTFLSFAPRGFRVPPRPVERTPGGSIPEAGHGAENRIRYVGWGRSTTPGTSRAGALSGCAGAAVDPYRAERERERKGKEAGLGSCVSDQTTWDLLIGNLHSVRT